MGFIEPGRSIKRRRVRNKSLEKKEIRNVDTDKGEKEQKQCSFLERLPSEIVQEIFINVGIEENNLPLVSKYFSGILKLNVSPPRDIDHVKNDEKWRNLWLVEKLMSNFYLHNLNKNIDMRGLSKILKVISKRKGFNRDTESFKKLMLWLKIYERESVALDNAFFKFKFISEALLLQLKDRNLIVISTREIEKAQVKRNKYILGLWNSFCRDVAEANMEIDEFSSLNIVIHQPTNNDTNMDGTGQSPEPESAIEVSDRKGYTDTPDFPSNFYNGISTIERFKLVQTMKDIFNFNFFNKNLILINTYVGLDLESIHISKKVTEFIVNSNKSSNELLPQTIIELFKAIIKHQHKNPLIVDDLYPCVMLLLDKFYQQENARQKDDDIWLYVKSVKSLTLFSILLKFNGNPSDEILKSMDL